MIEFALIILGAVLALGGRLAVNRFRARRRRPEPQLPHIDPSTESFAAIRPRALQQWRGGDITHTGYMRVVAGSSSQPPRHARPEPAQR